MVVPSKWLPGGDDSGSETAYKMNQQTNTAVPPPSPEETETTAPVNSKGSGLGNIIGIIVGIIGGIMVLLKISDWLSGGSSSSGGRTYQCINGHTMTSAFIPGKCIWCGSTMWPK
tara:strand:- start:103 stop:447 length:345 start_codon:yes stop_codon:yes gene_type:complete